MKFQNYWINNFKKTRIINLNIIWAMSLKKHCPILLPKKYKLNYSISLIPIKCNYLKKSTEIVAYYF
jgi:hypothetical protein